jgi:hypothetical protein
MFGDCPVRKCFLHAGQTGLSTPLKNLWPEGFEPERVHPDGSNLTKGCRKEKPQLLLQCFQGQAAGGQGGQEEVYVLRQ